MMSIRGKGIRAVAFFLVFVLAGYFCFAAWAPTTDAEKGKADNSTSVTSASGEEDTPGVQEQEAPAKVKKKHFPWIWVAAGVVVAGVIIYFTVIKKPEYKLTVAVGTGVSGTPASGTSTYKKGKKISYSFTLKDGYKNLRVYLNGAAVSAAGEIEMNRQHYLVAAATEVSYYDLTVTLGTGVTGSPAAGVTTHKEMTSVAYSYAEASGYTNLKVQVDGVDASAQGTLLMDRGHALSATAEKIPDASGQWQLTFTMVKKGTVTTVATFIPNPPYIRGFVRTSGGGFDYSVGGHYELKGREIVMWFGSYYNVYSFNGSLNDDDNRMSGLCWIESGDPPNILDSGTWSAYRLY